MIKITREDILKLGQISNISLTDEEIPPLVEKLQAVLSYAEYLKEVAEAQQACEPMPKNSNIARNDEVIPTPAEPLLALAPQREDHFYVVPMILKGS